MLRGHPSGERAVRELPVLPGEHRRDLVLLAPEAPHPGGRRTGGASGGRRSRSRDRAASRRVVACADDVPGRGVGDGQRRPAGDPGGGGAPRPRAGRAWWCRTRPRSGRDAGELACIAPLGVARDRRHERRPGRRRRRGRVHRDRRHPARRRASPTSSRAWRPGPTWCRRPSTRCCTRRARPRRWSRRSSGPAPPATPRCSCRASTRAGRSTSSPSCVSGVCAGIEEIRVQEIFNYALYDAPDVVRDVIGFGGPMDSTPLMLLDVALEMVWAPMVRILGRGARRRARRRDDARRAATARAHDRRAGHGHLRGGHAGRVPVRGAGHRRRSPAARGRARHPHRRRLRARVAHVDAHRAAIHRVRISGHPNLDVTIHGTEPGEPGAAGGGNATAANRIVNAIPAVCDAPAGPLSVARPPADHRRRAATPLTAPAAARARYRPGSPSSRRR